MKQSIRLWIGGMIILAILGLFSGCGKSAAEIGKDFDVTDITGLRLENRSQRQEDAWSFTVETDETGALSLEIDLYSDLEGERTHEIVVPDPDAWNALRAALSGKKLKGESAKAPDKGTALFLQKNREDSWRLVSVKAEEAEGIEDLLWDAARDAKYLPSGFGYSRLVSFMFKEVNTMIYPGNTLYGIDREDSKWIASYQIPGMEEPIRKDVDDAFAGKVLSIVKEYDLGSWDGYHKVAKNVLDGSMFECTLKLASGETVSASGSNSFPRGYSETQEELRTLYLTVFPEN